MLGDAKKCCPSDGRGSQHENIDSINDYVFRNRFDCIDAGGYEYDGGNVNGRLAEQPFYNNKTKEEMVWNC